MRKFRSHLCSRGLFSAIVCAIVCASKVAFMEPGQVKQVEKDLEKNTFVEAEDGKKCCKIDESMKKFFLPSSNPHNRVWILYNKRKPIDEEATQNQMKQAELLDAASIAQESVEVGVKPERALQMPVERGLKVRRVQFEV